MSTGNSAVKFLFVLVLLGVSSCTQISVKQNALCNCAVLAAVLFTTLIENLRFCSSTEAGLFLIYSLYLSKNEPRILIKLFL